MKLIAKHNYVVVKLDDAEIKEHPSGLAVTAQRTEAPCYGVITSIGPNSNRKEFSVGTHVLVPPAGVGEVFYDNLTAYLILLDHEIYGTINDS